MAGMKKTPQVYLFYGEESYLVQKMAASLVESLLEPSEREFNLTLLEADPTVGELLHLVESAPFFGERKVVVVKNSRLFQAPRRKASDVEDDEAEETGGAVSGGETEMKESGDAADPRLLQLVVNMPEYATLIFTALKADKRKKLVKLVAEHGQVRELSPFKPREEQEIRQWVQDQLAEQGKRLDKDAMEHLMTVISTMNQVPRGFLSAEIEKAALYAGPDPVIGKQALEAVMAAVPEISAFAMTDALARRNVGQALARLEELFGSKEPPLKIIGLLAYNVRRWWQIRQVMDRRGSEAEMLAALGAKSENPGMARRTINQSRSFSGNALKQGLLTLADANAAIRSGGDPKPYLERVIIELCQ